MRGMVSMQYAANSATATGNAASIGLLLTILRMEAGRPITDKTNLQSLYDFKLQFTPERMSNPAARPRATATDSAVAADPAPTLFTTIQEQLGLKLESATGLIEVRQVDL
jgi:uncharacterized protein (TIGR03435 family)